MHKNLHVQLPDLRMLDVKVDFSVKVFRTVVQLCKDLGIRHPEELSFCKPLEHHHLKCNYKEWPKKKLENGVQKNGHLSLPPDTNTFIANSSPGGSTGSLDKPPFLCAPVTPSRIQSSTPINSPQGNGTVGWKNEYNTTLNGSYLDNSASSEFLNGTHDSSLAQSPSLSYDARKTLVRPKSLVEKARMNVAWLDSSLSIMEQGVHEFGFLCLRFKFYDFYDLNPKYDAVRINQIYEQAKWQLLNEEIDCTEEEMLMFAALQLQINRQVNQPQPNNDNASIVSPGDDDIDAALTELETTLEGAAISNNANDITQVPELHDELRFLKPKRFTLKGYKKYWFTCRDLHLYLHKSKEEMIHRTSPAYSINLRGCEVTPDVNISQQKYGIKLEVASSEGMSEMYIRCDNESQYAKWMACCKLASKGRSLADSSYEAEKKTILDFLQMQKPADSPALNPNSLNIQVEDYIALNILKIERKAVTSYCGSPCECQKFTTHRCQAELYKSMAKFA
ncbi:hypothetical protein HHI36_002794 [Cryptolaemus montrouzieri]|uniref:PH domain-containing protein n=1 Tax=Cryptolaemus montrouzieri TaxID=559131 RepID=A0ABD2PBJ4_9CUCU